MAYEKIDLETPQPNGKVGEPGPTAWAKARRMFSELYKGWTEQPNSIVTTDSNGAPRAQGFSQFLTTAGFSDFFKGLVDDVDAATLRSSIGTVLQSSKIDSTSGRILTTGAGGLLGTPPAWVGNINDVNAVPLGRVTVNKADAGNSGTFPSDYGILTTYGSPNEGVMQEWSERQGSETAAVVLFRRYLYTGKVGPWRQVYDQGNILRATAFSGALPTGGIIEHGANANGRYTKFADGTMECWHFHPTAAYTNIQNGNVYLSDEVAWVFPAAFVGSAVVRGSASYSHRWVGDNDPSAYQANFRVIGGYLDGGTANYARLHAIGRWG